MSDILDLANMQSEDEELVPEILSVDARLAIRGSVSVIAQLFERAASVAPKKEIIDGTAFSLLEAFSASPGNAAYARITATDGDQTLTVSLDGIQVLMEGAALIPAKKVHDILKLAPTDTVKIEVLGNSALIRSGRAQWTVQTPVGDSLPSTPDVDSIKRHTVPRTPLMRALAVARKAANSSTTRPALQQVQIRNQTVTGLDGGRLHRADLQGLHKDVQLDIPVKVVDELLRALLKSDAEYVEIGGDSKNLVFQVDEDRLAAQRMLVSFPDVEGLLLKPAFSNTHSLTLPRQALYAAVKRVRVNSDPDHAGIFLSLVKGAEADTWGVSVRSRDKIGNTAQEVVEADWLGDLKAFEICVNHKHLMDLLECATGDTIEFKLGKDTKTTKNPIYTEGNGLTAFIQQMRPDWLQ